MKKSEKLLDAIGQIDDSLVEEAALAGKKEAAVLKGMKSAPVEHKKKRKKKSAAIYRWQGALAACAVLAVCVGIFGLLNSQGLILSPFDRNEAADTAEEAAFEEEAAKQEISAEVTGDVAMGENQEKTSVTNFYDKGMGSAEQVTAGEKDSASEEIKSQAEQEADAKASTKPEDETLPQQIQTTEMQQSESGETEVQAGQLPMIASELEGEPVFEGEPAESTEESTESEQGTEEAVNVKVTLTGFSSGILTFEISNRETSKTLYYDSDYYLEQKSGDEWTKVVPVGDGAWEDVRTFVDPQMSREEEVDISALYGDLQPGKYRLVKSCQIGQENQKEAYTLYVEFEAE